MDGGSDRDTLLDERAAARLLSVSARTLQHWRYLGGGPRFAKLGRRVLYRHRDLMAFIEGRLLRNTSGSVTGARS